MKIRVPSALLLLAVAACTGSEGGATSTSGVGAATPTTATAAVATVAAPVTTAAPTTTLPPTTTTTAVISELTPDQFEAAVTEGRDANLSPLQRRARLDRMAAAAAAGLAAAELDVSGALSQIDERLQESPAFGGYVADLEAGKFWEDGETPAINFSPARIGVFADAVHFDGYGVAREGKWLVIAANGDDPVAAEIRRGLQDTFASVGQAREGMAELTRERPLDRYAVRASRPGLDLLEHYRAHPKDGRLMQLFLWYGDPLVNTDRFLAAYARVNPVVPYDDPAASAAGLAYHTDFRNGVRVITAQEIEDRDALVEKLRSDAVAQIETERARLGLDAVEQNAAFQSEADDLANRYLAALVDLVERDAPPEEAAEVFAGALQPNLEVLPVPAGQPVLWTVWMPSPGVVLTADEPILAANAVQYGVGVVVADDGTAAVLILTNTESEPQSA